MPSPLFKLPLDALLLRLQREGFVFGVDLHLQLQQLLRSLGHEYLNDPESLKRILAPVLAKSQEQQIKFYRIFDEYYQEVVQRHVAQVLKGESDTFVPNPQASVKKSRVPRWLAPLILVLSAGLLAVIFLVDIVKPLSPLHPQFSILTDSTTLFAENQTPRFPIGSSVVFENQSQELAAESSAEAQGIEFIWDFGDGSPRVITQSEREIAHSYSEPGTYYASLGAARTDGTADSTVSLPIEIYCPDAIFLQFDYAFSGSSPTTDDYLRFTPDVAGVATSELTYAWDFGDGITATEASPVHKYEQPGSYTVRLRVYRTDTLDFACSNVANFSRFIAIAKPEAAITLATRPLKKDQQPEAQMAFTSLALILLALLAALLMIGAGLLLMQYRKRDYSPKNTAKYKAGDQGPFSIPYPRQDHLISPDVDLYTLAAAMRRRQEGDLRKLDIRSTIRQTIREAGMPNLAFDTASRPSEYLILIEQPYQDSHQTRLFARIVEILAHEDVAIETYFFDTDMRICWNEDHTDGIRWEQLRQRYRNRQLILFSKGHALIDPFEAKLEAWVPEAMEPWKDRALLFSPVPVADWGYQERLLRQVFTILPVDIQGQLRMTDLPGSQDLPDYDTLRQDLIALIPVAAESLAAHDLETVEGLRSYLGPELFRWVAATLVYPWPVWEMTLAIGKALSKSTATDEAVSERPEERYLLTYTHLLRIARIPWMHSGDVPTSLRLDLLQALDPETERLARTTILEILGQIHLRNQAFVAKKLAIQETTNRFMLTPGDEEIAREMNYLLRDGQITDQPLLKKLGIPSEQFNGESPRAHLKRRFAPVKPLEIAAAVLITVVFSGAFGFFVRKKLDRTPELKNWTQQLHVDSTRLVSYISQLDSAIYFNNKGVEQYTDSADRVLSISQFTRAILHRQQQGQADYPLAYYNRALVDYNEGVVAFSNEQYEKAIRDFELSLQQVSLPTEVQRQETEPVSARSKGRLLFNQYCASCHAMDRNLVGPALGGILQKYAGKEDWLYRWIRNAPQMISSGDSQAVALYEAYNKSMQPAFPMLTNTDIDLILAYIDTNPEARKVTESQAQVSAEMPQQDSLSLLLAMDNLHGIGLAHFYLGQVQEAQNLLEQINQADSTYFDRVRPNLLDLIDAEAGAYRRYFAQADSSLKRKSWLMAITYADSALQVRPEDKPALAIQTAAQQAINAMSIEEQVQLAVQEARSLFGKEEYALAKGRYEEGLKLAQQDDLAYKKYFPEIEAGIAQCDQFLTGISSSLAFYSDLDAACDFGNGKVYLFKKDRCIRYDKRTGTLDTGFPQAIATAFPQVPARYHRDLDAVLNYTNTDIYFIKGANMVKYNLRTKVTVEGPLSRFIANLPANFRGGIEAATSWDNGKNYLIKGSDYLGYVANENQVGLGYPRPIKETWKSLPDSWHQGFDAAFFSFSQKKCYIFKGSEYVLYDSPTDQIDPGYPQSIGRLFPKDLVRTFSPVIQADTVQTPSESTQPASKVLSIRNDLLQGENIDISSLAQFFKRDNNPQYIVLSYSASNDVSGIIAKIINENTKIKSGYHVLIDRSGKVRQLLSFDKYTIGLGRATFGKKGARELEQEAIIIQLVNEGWLRPSKIGYETASRQPYSGEVYTGSFRGYQYWQPYTPKQIQVTGEVCKLLVKQYGITEILTGSDIAPDNYSLGPAFPIDKFRAEMLAYTPPQQQQSMPTEGVGQYAKANYVGKSGCPEGSFFDPADGGTCWTCPEGFTRTLNPVTSDNACERATQTEYKQAIERGKGTGLLGTDCPPGAFWDPNGRCYTCPSGYQRTIYSVTSNQACSRLVPPARTKATQIVSVGAACPEGSFQDSYNGGTCWTCPEGYVRSPYPVNGEQACVKK